MKKLITVVGLAFVSALIAGGLLAYCRPGTLQNRSALAGASAGPELKLDDFYLLDHQGRGHALYRQSASKAVVLISTANGCPAMKEAAPKLKALRDQFGSQG